MHNFHRNTSSFQYQIELGNGKAIICLIFFAQKLVVCISTLNPCFFLIFIIDHFVENDCMHINVK